MADENKVTLVVELDAKDAAAAVDLFGKEAVRSVEKAEKGFSGLRSGLQGTVAQLAAVTAAFGVFGKAIAEATESDRAIRQLSIAIAGTGEFSRQAVESFREFSEEISGLTGIDDDVIIQSLSLAKSFGITNDQARELVRAATNLSAVTGQDLESAVKQLGGTFDGTIGKLANLGSEFRDLTKDQVANGEVINLINKNYGEASATLGDTFEGSINRLKNTVNDGFKEIGNAILGDTSVRVGIEAIAQSILALTPIIAQVVKFFLDGVKIIANGINATLGVISSALSDIAGLAGFDDLSNRLAQFSVANLDASIALSQSFVQFEKTDTAATKLDVTLQKVSENAKKAGSQGGKAAEDLAKKFQEAQTKAGQFLEGIFLKTGTDIERSAKEAAKNLDEITKFEQQGVISFEEAFSAREQVIKDFNEKASKLTQDRLNEEQDKLDKAAEKEKKRQEEIAGIVGGAAVGAVTAENQEQRFSSIGSTLSQGLGAAFGPLGSVGGQFITAIAQGGREQTKEFVSGFIRAIPEFVVAFVDALPGVFEGLIEVLSDPNFWVRVAFAFANAFLSIISGFGLGQLIAEGIQKGTLDGFGEVLSQLFDGLKEAFNQYIEGFQKFWANIFQTLTQTFANAIKEFVVQIFQLWIQGGNILKEALFAPVNALTDFLRNFSFPSIDIGGGGGGGFFGFSSGGVVPGPSGAGDIVPAMLSPGELVVPTDLVGQLSSFLSGGGQGGNSAELTAIMMAVLQKLSEPITVESQLSINQNAFADIILQLTRQNARLTA